MGIRNHTFYIFQLATPINGLTVAGAVYAECAYTVPVAAKETISPIFFS